jgi:hypothetical protein
MVMNIVLYVPGLRCVMTKHYFTYSYTIPDNHAGTPGKQGGLTHSRPVGCC